MALAYPVGVKESKQGRKGVIRLKTTHLRLLTRQPMIAQIDADEASTLIDQILDGLMDVFAAIPTLFLIGFQPKKGGDEG